METPARTYRAIIADDEPPARRLTREYLSAYPQIAVVAECGSGGDAVEEIQRHEPDLVFLDVEMPGASGFEVLSSLAHQPHVIFCTAHEEHAVQAFDTGAVDYLLKPFRQQRFRLAVDRFLATARTARPGPAAPVPLTRLLIHVGNRIVAAEVSGLAWAEAVDGQSRLHFERGSYLCGLTLNELEERLGPTEFVRVHRSAIVAFSAIDYLQSDGSGGYVVTLKGRERLRVSRSRAAHFRSLIV
jgi:two-component system LytT family response regulator